MPRDERAESSVSAREVGGSRETRVRTAVADTCPVLESTRNSTSATTSNRHTQIYAWVGERANTIGSRNEEIDRSLAAIVPNVPAQSGTLPQDIHHMACSVPRTLLARAAFVTYSKEP